jgi:indole-3-acetate monooxygenase
MQGAGTVATAKTFRAEIRERAAAIERERRMPGDLAARMAAAGMFRLLVPRALRRRSRCTRSEFFDTLVDTATADGAVGWCQMIGATTGILSASLPSRTGPTPSTAPIPTASARA